MYKFMAAIALVLGVMLVRECVSAPAYQVLEPRDGYIPVYIQLGDTPLSEIDPMLAAAFGDVSVVHSSEKEDERIAAPKEDEESSVSEEAIAPAITENIPDPVQAVVKDDESNSDEPNNEASDDDLPHGHDDESELNEEPRTDSPTDAFNEIEDGIEDIENIRERRETVEPVAAAAEATPEATTPVSAPAAADATKVAGTDKDNNSSDSSDSSEEKKSA